MRIHSIFPFAAVLAIALTDSAFAGGCRPINSFEQGHELRQNQLVPAYNAPGRIEVRGSWDLSLSGSYLFWQPSQDNLELGIESSSDSSPNGHVVGISSHYSSGFKAALGVYSDHDDWDACLTYTWLRPENQGHVSSPENGVVFPCQGCPNNSLSTVQSGEASWRLSFDFLDLDLGRSGYVGTKLSLRPFFGIRGARIHQHYSPTYVSDTGVSYKIHNSSDASALGPRAGLDASWFFGYGLRAIGSAESDLLFTRYDLHTEEENSRPPQDSSFSNITQNHCFSLRPHLDLEFGLGWGTYFANHNWHVDLSATYGFQMFWSQNMFRNFTDDVMQGKSNLPNGDLYVQGVTANLKFDF